MSAAVDLSRMRDRWPRTGRFPAFLLSRLRRGSNGPRGCRGGRRHGIPVPAKRSGKSSPGSSAGHWPRRALLYWRIVGDVVAGVGTAISGPENRTAAFSITARAADRARLQQCFREREPVAGLPGVGLQRRRQKTQRQRKVTLADGQCAKRVVGVRVIRLGFQDAAEQPLRIVDTPGVEVRQTLANSFVAGTGARIHLKEVPAGSSDLAIAYR
jgi:hypothetical protein